VVALGKGVVAWKKGVAVDSKNNDGLTALMVAAQYGQVGAMRVLLEAGCGHA